MAGTAFVQIAFGALLGFAGSLLIWGVQQWSETRKNERKAKEEVERVRTLLRLESERNIRAVQELWAASVSPANMVPNVSYDSDMTEFQHRLDFVRQPLPPLSHEHWNTLGLAIPLALRQAEIQGMYALYDQLDEFVTRRERLRGVVESTTGTAAFYALIEQRASSPAAMSPLDQAVEAGRLASLRQINEVTFGDFHGERGRLGCEGIQASLRNPVEQSPEMRGSAEQSALPTATNDEELRHEAL